MSSTLKMTSRTICKLLFAAKGAVTVGAEATESIQSFFCYRLRAVFGKGPFFVSAFWSTTGLDDTEAPGYVWSERQKLTPSFPLAALDSRVWKQSFAILSTDEVPLLIGTALRQMVRFFSAAVFFESPKGDPL